MLIISNYIKSGIISTDEDPSLRIENVAIIKIRGISTKYKLYFSAMQTYKEILYCVDSLYIYRVYKKR